jgi:hypothetical protein
MGALERRSQSSSSPVGVRPTSQTSSARFSASNNASVEQSRSMSVIEVLTSTFTGTIGSLVITYCILRFSPYGLEVNSVLTVAACTVWSLVRGYAVRRYFATRTQRSRPLRERSANQAPNFYW